MSFIQPKDRPCLDCSVFTPDDQCVVCGWLCPLPGDPPGFREVPLGPPQMCTLDPPASENQTIEGSVEPLDP